MFKLNRKVFKVVLNVFCYRIVYEVLIEDLQEQIDRNNRVRQRRSVFGGRKVNGKNDKYLTYNEVCSLKG